MALSGVEAAIRELEREQKKIRDAFLMLKRIRAQNADPGGRQGRKRLSPRARRRISEAAKKTLGGVAGVVEVPEVSRNWGYNESCVYLRGVAI